MEFFDIVILSLIQGITEFLPISSSGHLALWPLLTGRPDQGAVMDAAVHVGTLVAVCWFFRAEVGRLFAGTGHILTGRVGTPAARMVWLLALATLPAIAVGLAIKAMDAQAALRTVELIGWTTLGGGLLLWAADRAVARRGAAESWSTGDAVLMGLAQAVALVPGVSRSGITMTMARFLGFDRVQAARLALLMAVPVILAAGTVEVLGVVRAGDFRLGVDMVLGAVLSCVAALVALSVMMRMFAGTWTMLPFVLYRVALGAFLLAIAYGAVAPPGGRRLDPRGPAAQNRQQGRTPLRLAPLILCLCLAPAVAPAVEEPAGYRTSDYDAPVPETLAGAHVVEDDAAHALWLTGRVVFFDVMPNVPRPANLPKSVLWQGRPRMSVPGAVWLPYAGFGELSRDERARFAADLANHTGGQPDAPVLFLCRADCWMSWNAARRAVELGYSRVFWYPQGTTGWTFWDWPTERLRRP